MGTYTLFEREKPETIDDKLVLENASHSNISAATIDRLAGAAVRHAFIRLTLRVKTVPFYIDEQRKMCPSRDNGRLPVSTRRIGDFIREYKEGLRRMTNVPDRQIAEPVVVEKAYDAPIIKAIEAMQEKGFKHVDYECTVAGKPVVKGFKRGKWFIAHGNTLSEGYKSALYCIAIAGKVAFQAECGELGENKGWRIVWNHREGVVHHEPRSLALKYGAHGEHVLKTEGRRPAYFDR